MELFEQTLEIFLVVINERNLLRNAAHVLAPFLSHLESKIFAVAVCKLQMFNFVDFRPSNCVEV